ncbi:MAG: hypothetical protein ABW189_02535 [Rickettsiales bacterium]
MGKSAFRKHKKHKGGATASAKTSLKAFLCATVSAASLSACRAHEAAQLESYVQSNLHKYISYESSDKRASFQYVGRKHAAASSGSDFKQYGGFSFKNNESNEERVFALGKRDNYYMAETPMFPERYKGAFMAFGIEKDKDVSPFVHFHIEF